MPQSAIILENLDSDVLLVWYKLSVCRFSGNEAAKPAPTCILPLELTNNPGRNCGIIK